MKRIPPLLTLLLCAVFPLARAGDLDAPGAKVVTVRSEIQRGEGAAMGLDPLTDIVKYTAALDLIQSQNEQANTDSPGFYLGFCLEAWQRLWLAIDSPAYKGPAMSIAVRRANVYFEAYHHWCHELGLTVDQVKSVTPLYDGAEEDERWQRAFADQKFVRTYFHKNP